MAAEAAEEEEEDSADELLLLLLLDLVDRSITEIGMATLRVTLAGPFQAWPVSWT